MADRKKRLSLNVPGEFFVDSTCIDCDTCRQLAPSTFEDSGEFSFVYAQPECEKDRRSAMHALLSCPTGSIGVTGHNDAGSVVTDFPLALEDEIYYCGFNSPKSYGGNSYFLTHKEGNWLIDSPKFLPHLIKRFEQMGGIAYLFLTHRDDVAEAHKYAQHFGCKRIIHREDLDAQPDAEVIIEGTEVVSFLSDFKIIPTPGHTRGHCVLLYKDRYLFSGDHLWFSRERQRLAAGKSVCWYSWTEQTKSMEKLTNFQFEWVLTGHGQRIKLPADEMHRQLVDLVATMQLS
jgi:glyoxylase-like metal-dependent hydrolase (beta-lactamase superfamily II)/ferredoxin